MNPPPEPDPPRTGTGTGTGTALPGPGANLPALRGHNAALVLGLLRDAAVAGGTVSRLELAGRTGLTPQAVSKITARLRAAGLVEEAGRRASTGGKPLTELRLAAGAAHAIGVHLDGEQLTAVRTDLAGRTVSEHTVPLDLSHPVPRALDEMTAAIRTVIALAGPPVLGVGIGIRGPLDHRTGTLHALTGYPHWSGCPLRAELTARLGLPVSVDKNTNAAALSILAEPERAQDPGAEPGPEQEPGAAPGSQQPRPLPGPGGLPPAGPGPFFRPAGLPPAVAGDARSFAYLHLGTGLGAALVLDGVVHRGGSRGAGEFGHQVIALGGLPCKCGKRGCLEALCLAAVERGDLGRAAELLGVGAANLVALLDVRGIVLGGRTVLGAPEVFRAAVAAALAPDGVPVGFAAAGPRAVAEGAALLALAPLFSAGPLAGRITG
ncbi:ROK family transcriptional regulator [Streptomyces sp. CA-111067]|uniref:ROK family transcriptional regulator n=1 Tax=Streptomyces sp. CA-111067 TaxID=3240046 RepID=UPI003D962DD4